MAQQTFCCTICCLEASLQALLKLSKLPPCICLLPVSFLECLNIRHGFVNLLASMPCWLLQLLSFHDHNSSNFASILLINILYLQDMFCLKDMLLGMQERLFGKCQSLGFRWLMEALNWLTAS